MATLINYKLSNRRRHNKTVLIYNFPYSIKLWQVHLQYNSSNSKHFLFLFVKKAHLRQKFMYFKLTIHKHIQYRINKKNITCSTFIYIEKFTHTHRYTPVDIYIHTHKHNMYGMFNLVSTHLILLLLQAATSSMESMTYSLNFIYFVQFFFPHIYPFCFSYSVLVCTNFFLLLFPSYPTEKRKRINQRVKSTWKDILAVT